MIRKSPDCKINAILPCNSDVKVIILHHIDGSYSIQIFKLYALLAKRTNLLYFKIHNVIQHIYPKLESWNAVK